MGLMFFQQFVGINALIYYSPTLFQTTGLDHSMQLIMSGVLNITQLVGVSIWTGSGEDHYYCGEVGRMDQRGIPAVLHLEQMDHVFKDVRGEEELAKKKTFEEAIVAKGMLLLTLER
ncbi:hypothetical protein LTR16_002027, partial [Cryomyces antarcticus]